MLPGHTEPESSTKLATLLPPMRSYHWGVVPGVLPEVRSLLQPPHTLQDSLPPRTTLRTLAGCWQRRCCRNPKICLWPSPQVSVSLQEEPSTRLTIGHPCIWKVFPALLPQKSVLKIICWSKKWASKLHEPWKLATGAPNSARRGVADLLLIDGGIAFLSKVHISMPWEVQSMAKTPPPTALRSAPARRFDVTAQPVYELANAQSLVSSVPDWPEPAILQFGSAEE